MNEAIMMLGIIGVAAAFAGLLAGLFGVGGGIILVPVFVYAFEAMGYHHPQVTQIAVATSLATIIFTSIRSVRAHHEKGAVDWEILKTWALPVSIGSLLGVVVASQVSAKALLIVFSVLALLIAANIGFGIQRYQLGNEMPKGAKKNVIASAIGFFSTLMGIGGGSLSVPIQVLYGRPIHSAVATGAGIGALIAIPSTLGFLIAQPSSANLPPYTLGYVNLPAFVLVIIMTYFTAPIGARLAHKLDAVKLKRYFALFIVVVALNMVRKSLLM